MRAVLTAASKLTTRHPVAVLACCGILTLLALFPAKRALDNMDSDFDRLVPKTEPACAALREARDQLPTLDLVIVTVQLEPNLPVPGPHPWTVAHEHELTTRFDVDLSLLEDPRAVGVCEGYLEKLTEYREFRRRSRQPMAGDPQQELPEVYRDLQLAYDRALAELAPLRDEQLPIVKDFVDSLGARLEVSDLIQSVEYKAGESQRSFLRDYVTERLILYLEEPELTELRTRLQTSYIRERMRQARAALSADRELFKSKWQPDPLGFTELAKDRDDRYARKLSYGEGGYFLSPDRSMLLLIVRGTTPAAQTEYTTALLTEIEESVDSASQSLGDLAPNELRSFVSIGLANHYPYIHYEWLNTRRAVTNTFLLSLLLIVLLFLLVYRRVDSLLFISLPLIVAVIWLMAIVGLLSARISAISGSFAAVLAGLGVDYGIHIYNRYRSERLGGLPAAAAIEKAITATGRGIMLGAGTTMAGFLALLFTRLPSMREFGLLLSAGIPLCMLTMLLILPSLLMLRSRFERGATANRGVSGLGLGRLSDALQHHYRLVFAAGLILLGTSAAHIAVTLHDDFFDSDFRKLRSANNPAIAMNDNIASKFGSDLVDIVVLTRGDSVEEAIREADALFQETVPLIQSGLLFDVDTILRFVPTAENQERCVTFMRAEVDFEKLSTDVSEASIAAGMRSSVFEEFLTDIDSTKALSESPEFITVKNLESDEALASLTSRYHGRGPSMLGGGEYKVATFLQTRPAEQTAEWYEELGAALGIDGVRRSLTSIGLAGLEIKEILARDSMRLIALVLVAVLSVLSISFYSRSRGLVVGVLTSLGWALLTLSPVALALLWMISIMLALGWTLNPANIAILPAIIGIGIDDGIHMVNRFREPSDMRSIIAGTGRAVIVTSLTTILAFGSLMITTNRAFQSLGALGALGIACAMISSIVFFSASLILLRRRVQPTNRNQP